MRHSIHILPALVFCLVDQSPKGFLVDFRDRRIYRASPRLQSFFLDVLAALALSGCRDSSF